ncbi:MAG: DUF2062 domain-containing protein [Saprospiraceae bacterium]
MFSKTAGLFSQGLSPQLMAWSVSIGLVFGIFPFLGVTTLLLTGLAFVSRLNLPIMISISYLAFPLQIGLFIPFLRLGKNISLGDGHLIPMSEISAQFEASFWMAVQNLWRELLYSFLGWLVLAVPIALFCYWVSLQLILLFLQARTRYREKRR